MDLRKLNLKLTKKAISEAVTKDVLVIQCIHTIDELIKGSHRLETNLRERYGYYAPKQSKIEDGFFNIVKKLKKEEMSGNFSKKDLDSILDVVNAVENLNKVINSQEKYIESLINKICKHTMKVCDVLVIARLLSHAGSLKNLAKMPSSTIQMLGAEKALFRHLRRGTKPPKFGVIYADKSIGQSKEKGKAARKLASKISIAIKKDYYG